MLSLACSENFPPAPAAFNMAAYVLAHADRLGDKTALEIVGADAVETRISYRDLKQAVLGTATGLLQHASTGDRVIIQLGNSPAFPIAYLGAIAAGLIPVCLSSALTPSEYDEIFACIDPAVTLRSNGTGRALSQQDLEAFYVLPPAAFALGDPERAAYIIFTSGTSGRPTPVVHAHRAIWARQMMWTGWYDLKEDDRIMHAGGFNWTYTLGTGLMDPWAIGATAVIPSQTVGPVGLANLIATHRATLFAASPGIYRRLLRGPVPNFPALRHGLSAGEAMARDVHDEWRSATGTRVYEAFGMSECSTFISASPDRPAPSGATGYAQCGRQVAVLDQDGPVPHGSVGMIGIHRSDPGLMLRYLDEPQETDQRFQGDWFLTGDMASMDASGAFTFVGRVDDMMNAGGFRISPIEVENAMMAHPTIQEAAACAVQVRTGVWVIAGFYVASDVIEEEALRSFLSGKLAAYKQPRLLIARDALPRGANNKLLRKVLRAEWETAYGQT